MNDLCRVVIVDDEYLVRQGIKHLLNWEEEGFQIVGEAGNGQEALEIIEEVRPHIVLTDIVMPVMDGEEFTRALKAIHPDIEIIVLSSFSEFEYVKSTFRSGVADYILKPTLETEGLLNVLKATADKIPFLNIRSRSTGEFIPSAQHILERLISGYEVKVDSDLIRETFPGNGFCYLGCQLKHLLSKESKEIAQYKSRVFTEVGEYLSSKKISHHMITMDSMILVLLLNFDSLDTGLVMDSLRGMAPSLAKRELQICWTVGDVFHHLDQAGVQYRDYFVKQMDYPFYYPHQAVLISSDLPILPKLTSKFDLNYFTEEIRKNRSEIAFQYLRNYVEELACQHDNEVYEFKAFLSNIIFNITTLLGNTDVDTVSLDEEKYVYFKKVDEARNAAEALSLLDFFLNQVKQLLNAANHKDSKPIDQLHEYIHEHYAEQLTLSGLAKHFHFNPTYLSSYFSAHAKEGFSEYLNKIRIDKAAELLRENRFTISEISGKVGYSEHSYFCKVFKKSTGQSPSTYRKKYTSLEK